MTWMLSEDDSEAEVDPSSRAHFEDFKLGCLPLHYQTLKIKDLIIDLLKQLGKIVHQNTALVVAHRL